MAKVKSKWNKENIKELLMENDTAVVRGLMKIYEKQTDYEKNVGTTLVHNNVGFTGADSKILSSFAKFYQRKGFLSSKQLFVARKRMIKYSGQLADIVNGKR